RGDVVRRPDDVAGVVGRPVTAVRGALISPPAAAVAAPAARRRGAGRPEDDGEAQRSPSSRVRHRRVASFPRKSRAYDNPKGSRRDAGQTRGPPSGDVNATFAPGWVGREGAGP